MLITPQAVYLAFILGFLVGGAVVGGTVAWLIEFRGMFDLLGEDDDCYER